MLSSKDLCSEDTPGSSSRETIPEIRRDDVLDEYTIQPWRTSWLSKKLRIVIRDAIGELIDKICYICFRGSSTGQEKRLEVAMLAQ